MSKSKREIKSDEPEQQQPEAKSGEANGGILANDHDNDKLGKDIARLLDGLAKRGVAISLERIDLNNLKARVESYAACQILVAKGIATEAEMAAACNREFRAILATILQLVEEQRLKSQPKPEDRIITPQGSGRKLQVVKPKLAVVHH